MNTIVLVIWLASALGCAAIASGKGRSPIVWGVAGFLFGFLGLIAAAVVPSKKTAW